MIRSRGVSRDKQNYHLWSLHSCKLGKLMTCADLWPVWERIQHLRWSILASHIYYSTFLLFQNISRP